ncbi:MAG: T9SS type A sorting domain-containing protein [Saprospiraceae bacterium]|nr:T9SS type A sorting domain-containing protein [Saprospiraceae bacterium]
MCKKLTLIFLFTLTAWLASAQLVDVITGISRPWSLALKGNDLYIGLDVAGKVIKIDKTQPMPTPVDVLTGLGSLGNGGLDIDGDTLYVGEYNHNKVVKLDISQSNPVPVDVVSVQQPFNILKSGNFLYVGTQGSGLKKFDLTNGMLVATYGFGSIISGLVLKGDLLYYSTGYEIYTIDESQANPTPIQLVWGLDSGYGLTLNGNFMYIAEKTQVRKIDLGQAMPQPVTVVSGVNGSRLTAFDGIDMYISEYYGNKVSKLTIGQPEFPTQPAVCLNTVPDNLGGASPTGGVYSGGPGLTDNGNGETYTFDPVMAGGVGNYTVTYTSPTGLTATTSVNVVTPPTASFTPPASVAIDAGVQTLSGMPAGGTFAGPGVSGSGFDPALAGLGMHSITYTYTDGNGCSDMATGTITVTPVIPADNVCSGATSINNLLGGPVNTPQVSTLYDNTNYNSTGDPAIGYECFFENDGLQHTIWYSFAGDGNQYRIRSVECTATNYILEGDTQAAIYNGDCNSLTPVACTEDEDANFELYNIDVTFVALPGVTYYMMVDGWNGKKGEFCLEVTNLGVSAAKEISTMGMKLYPNPTNGLVMFEGQTAQSVQVMDALGRTVHTQQTPAQQVDLSSLPGGMYTLLMDFGKEGLVSARVVKP